MKEGRLVQMRLSNQQFKIFNAVAREEGATKANILRKSIQLTSIMKNYQRQGRSLFWEDPKTKTRIKVILL